MTTKYGLGSVASAPGREKNKVEVEWTFLFFPYQQFVSFWS
jgi:hypothetical protein